MAAQSAQDLKDPWLRSYFLTRLSSLDRERSSFFTTWQDLAGQFAPRRGRFLSGANDSRRGARKDRRIIDNTPLLAARTMASGMMAGISSPARPWFRLRLATETLNEQPGVRAWLDQVQRLMLEVFARSNLYNCLHMLYGELGVFGTGALWVDEDEETVVRAYTLTVGEYWLASSRRLAVDTLYRSMWWTVRQIVDTFGRDAVSAGVRANYDAGILDLEYEIIAIVLGKFVKQDFTDLGLHRYANRLSDCHDLRRQHDNDIRGIGELHGVSHFAKVIGGIAVDVIVTEQSFIDSGLVGPATDWVRTSYNTRGGVHYGQDSKPDSAVALRANYVGIGDTYDVVSDVFFSPQPFPHWTIRAPAWLWQPPAVYPIDGNDYVWDERTGCWIGGGR